MAIKFSQFNLRTDHTSGMYLVGYDGNQNIHITVDNLFDDFINGTENTIAMFGTDGTVLADSILSQNADADEATITGVLNVTDTGKFETSIEVEGTADLFGSVNLGDNSTDLITQTGTLYLNGPIKDTTNTLGAVDQILVSDATGGLTFQDLASTHVESAEVVKVPVKNVQGSALVKGDPVYISGSVGASGRLEVQLADSSNSAKMPAVGLLFQDLANNGQGYVVITGKLRNLTTDPIDGVTPTEGDVIYVKPSGTSGAALTTTKPVYGNFIQNMGKVGRVSGGNSGTFVVSSILRSNDIPNLTPGRLWIGSTGNTIESQVLFVNEADNEFQVQTSMGHIILEESGSDGTKISFKNTGGTRTGTVENNGNENQFMVIRANGTSQTQGNIRLVTNDNEAVRIDENQRVGIGVTQPTGLLHVVDPDGTEDIIFSVHEGDFRVIATDTNGSFLASGFNSVAFTSIENDFTVSNKFNINNVDNYMVLGGTSGDSDTLTNTFESTVFTGTGNTGIGTTSPSSKLQVNGAVQVGDDTATASASKVGAIKYRTSGNNSYVDMCMQTGASTYAWVNIVQNNW